MRESEEKAKREELARLEETLLALRPETHKIRCKDCKWWSRSDQTPSSDYYNYGGCKKLDKDNITFDDSSGGSFILTGYGENAADYFLTRENFGCIFGERGDLSNNYGWPDCTAGDS